MTTTVDRIRTRAVAVDWRTVALLALMAVPYVLGWTVRTVARVVGWVLAWLWAAAVEGWHSAGPGDAGPK